jgi:FkbM family methyltransferase
MLTSIKKTVKIFLHNNLHDKVYFYIVVFYWKLKNYFQRNYEPEIKHLSEFIKRGDLVVDIGVNFGQYASKISRLVGEQGKVIGFEALPSTFKFTQKILSFSNIELHNVAISNHEHLAKMAIVKDQEQIINRGVTSITQIEKFDDDTEIVEVKAESLDALLKNRKKNVSFIKCDVEGHEIEVLQGAMKIIEKDHPIILVETSGHKLDSLTKMLAPYSYLVKKCTYDNKLDFLGKRSIDSENYFFI